MTPKELLDHILSLPAEDQQRLAELLAANHKVMEVREAAVGYPPELHAQTELQDMKSVTLMLPDELAKQAQAAGLFSEPRIEELIRRALQEQRTRSDAGKRERPLTRHENRLIAAALPDEQPIDDAEVRELLNRMEW